MSDVSIAIWADDAEYVILKKQIVITKSFSDLVHRSGSNQSSKVRPSTFLYACGFCTLTRSPLWCLRPSKLCLYVDFPICTVLPLLCWLLRIAMSMMLLLSCMSIFLNHLFSSYKWNGAVFVKEACQNLVRARERVLLFGKRNVPLLTYLRPWCHYFLSIIILWKSIAATYVM